MFILTLLLLPSTVLLLHLRLAGPDTLLDLSDCGLQLQLPRLVPLQELTFIQLNGRSLLVRLRLVVDWAAPCVTTAVIEAILASGTIP